MKLYTIDNNGEIHPYYNKEEIKSWRNKFMKNKRGGKRKGAGRKPSPIKTVTISFRVNAEIKDKAKEFIKEYLKNLQ